MTKMLTYLRAVFTAAVKHLSVEARTFIFITFASLLFLFSFTNMQPQVDEDFFFSSDDSQFRTEQRITELFVRADTQIIISATGDLSSLQYFSTIEELSNALAGLRGVTGVKSVSHGPTSFKDAVESPLWKRLLISDDKLSTNVIVLVDDKIAQQIVPDIERLIAQFSSDRFILKVSGIPYVLELIRRHLLRDIRLFSALAALIFGLVIYIIFRSKIIVAGTMISCLNACVWTFMMTDLLNVPIGLLTANLATIIFVLTLSHIVFLTYNWKNLDPGKTPQQSVEEAMRRTFPASFWSMLTTLLGFLSLTLVSAKPLKDLGVSGSAGTLIALFAAYGVYPAFLKLTHVKHQGRHLRQHRIYNFLERRKRTIRLIISVLFVFALAGICIINTDPSMLSFFSKNSEIYKGLHYIDRNGGSSPLVLVVQSSKEGETLNSQTAYSKLWKLQNALENHRSVGSIISLPVLMAQAKQAPLAKVLFWEWLLEILEKPQYEEVAKSFVTKDRRYGLFLLRMIEENRVRKRLDIVEEIKGIVEAHEFKPELMGGVYVLQGHLSKQVTSSLVGGLGKLMALFAVIAWIVSRSLRITAAVMVSIGIIPVGILGFIGLCGVPLDVISSPASNVAIAMGIDSMIHMIKAYHRKDKRSENVWQEIRDELWQPILTAMVVVTTGFTIFLFSTFPPTQRFGMTIVFGTVLSSLTALYIMPLLIEFRPKRFPVKWPAKLRPELFWRILRRR